MSDVTRLLDRFGAGDAAAADELLPLVYDELRRIARQQMAGEAAGHTLQATGLVHEAYLRLVRSGRDPTDDGSSADKERIRSTRGYFFAAASEAMRRILVDSARRRARLKRGGDRRRVRLDDVAPAELAGAAGGQDPDELLALDAALTRFEAERPRAAAVVKLRYFAGLSFEETAASLDVSRATAVRDWTFGRAWLHRVLEEGGPGEGGPGEGGPGEGGKCESGGGRDLREPVADRTPHDR